VFAFQKDKTWRSAEERPEFEDRSEPTKKRASEDVSDRHLKSADPTVEGGGENL
jgi:hypothetical protein